MVFSDLDGSLLDHETYSFAPAKEALARLASMNIPVILVSSKTRVEIERIRAQLGNNYPFIVENGAAVFVPKSFAPERPPGTADSESYWVYDTGQDRAHWLKVIAKAGEPFAGLYQTFFAAGAKGIEQLTGLDATGAELANQREFSEPVAWHGAETDKQQFVTNLEALGASVQQGGRFLSVSGDCDKGRALVWLRDWYGHSQGAIAIEDIAIGDSQNDVAMLEVAHTALLIKSPVHDCPSLQTSGTILRSSETGPAGWQEGVTNWLNQFNFKT